MTDQVVVEADTVEVLVTAPTVDVQVEVVGGRGPAGADGAPGPAGEPGSDSTVPGPPGATGPAGAASTVPGPPGEQGAVGPAGPQGEIGPQGSPGEFLSGSGPPPETLGVPTNYYLDEDGDTLYGPKGISGSYGATQNGIPAADTPTPGFTHPTIEMGGHFQFAVRGQIAAVRYWRDAATTQVARTVTLWNVTTHAILATASTPNDGGGATSGWKQIALTPPYEVYPNDVIVATVGNTNAYSRSNVTFPITAGGDVSLINGCYELSLGVWPNTTATINFFTDVLFRPLTGGVWPVALRGDTAPVVVLTQAAYDALTPKDAGTVYVVT